MDYRILGPLEVLAPDGPVPLGGAKQRALLAVLLLHANEVVSTDRLIDALWGEGPPETALKALQVHVSQLRKALGADVIRTRPPGYSLEVARDELDLDRFRRMHEEAGASAGSRPARARELLAEALALWRGPPLADLTYATFAQAEIARLEEMRIAAIEDRIAADLELGRAAGLIGELEPLSAAHPHRERLRGQLMLALYRSGRQAEALDVFREARAVLTEELGIEPGRGLRELHQAILEQDASLDRERTPPESRASSTFVGRERELAELRTALEEAVSGRGSVVLVGGEPGIGKSRLAEEVATSVGSRDVRLLTGRCWEAGGAPAYWPWLQALRPYVREADPGVLRESLAGAGGELVALLPELRERLPELPDAPSDGSEGARFRLLEAAVSFLAGASRAQPLAIFLDDLHAADASSLLLLRYVAAHAARSRLLVVGCFRDTELSPPLADVLNESAVRRVSLKGLGPEDTSRLLTLVVGAEPGEDLAARVQAETQGNPLFSVEFGRLVAAGDRLSIPEGVRDTIRRRVERQSSGCRGVLALASVMGREFDPEVVARLSGLDEDDLARVLDEAAASRLVEGVPDGAGRLRFTHILVRDALYEDLPAPRRFRLHRAAGDALEALFPDAHLAELAHHYLEAGTAVADKAVEYSQRAGDRAASQFGFEEAARHYENALRVLDARGMTATDHACDLLLALGEALSRAGDEREAKAALARGAAIAQDSGRPDQLARAALNYGGRFGWARASTDPALVPLLERALAAVGDSDVRTRVRLLARLAGAKRDDPLRDDRARLAEETVALAEAQGDPATLAFAIEGSWIALEGPDLIGDGVGVGERLIALGEQMGDRERVFAGHDHRIHTFWQLADRTGVELEHDALSALADELRQPAQHWHVGTGVTMLALMEGRFDEADELIADTLELGQRAESWNALVTQRLALFVLRRAQGRLGELEDVIARSVREYPALIRFRCALAHLYAELGREGDARRVLDDMLSRDLAHEHLDAEWLFSMALLADPCVQLGERAGAEKLYALLLPYEGLYAMAPVETVFGSMARGLGVLAATLDRPDAAARHFEVALEVERRMRARPWVAHAQHDYGAMLLDQGDVARAEPLLDEAAVTYRELGMESWAERVRALTQPTPTA
jgi:DNA-binding SARP family transcriptional activator